MNRHLPYSYSEWRSSMHANISACSWLSLTEKKQNKRDANASLQKEKKILYCREKWFFFCFCLNNLYITASHNQYRKKYFIIGKERELFKWNKTGLDRRWKVISQTDIFRRNPAVIEIAAAAAANVVAVDD